MPLSATHAQPATRNGASPWHASLLAASMLLTTACSGVEVGDQVPDFTLVDVNASSATFEQELSPDLYVAKVSAWYFGHAT